MDFRGLRGERREALIRALSTGDSATVQRIVTEHPNEAHVAVDEGGVQAIHLAAQQGDIASIEHLLAAGSSIDAVGDILRTPLHRATLSGHLNVVQFLLERKADPNATDIKEYSPLHSAIKQGYVGIVRELISSKADVNLVSKRKETVIHMACESKQEQEACILELLKVDTLNKTSCMLGNRNKQTPFHLLKSGSMCKILVQHSDSETLQRTLSVCDAFGRSPLQVAVQAGRLGVVSQLLLAGADPLMPMSANQFQPASRSEPFNNIRANPLDYISQLNMDDQIKASLEDYFLAAGLDISDLKARSQGAVSTALRRVNHSHPRTSGTEEVPSLQELCRWVIRRQYKPNTILSSISELPITESCKYYLVYQLPLIQHRN
eukprot:m.173009 g.173009  ORF g.173009 m.173009 type:complete len:378 (-) comp15380_c0_seq2:3856-4989(-)